MKCIACKNESELHLSGLYDDRYGYPGTFETYICPKCKHITLDARFDEEELKKLYTNYYPRSSFSVDTYRPLNEVRGFKGWFNGEKRAFAFVPPGVRILDIGCGFGESLGYHKARKCEVFGCETDANLLKVANKFDFNVHIGMFNEAHYAKEFFDYVTMDQVLEHSTDPEMLLRGVYQVLKQNGYLIITIPYAHGWGACQYGKKWLHWHVPYHMNFFSKKSLKILAAKTGFKILKQKTITSSEWLFYQKVQLAAFPEPGYPSYFFSPIRDWNELPTEAKHKRELITKWHRKKINHIITRFWDAIGLGDNLVIIMKKVD